VGSVNKHTVKRSFTNHANFHYSW